MVTVIDDVGSLVHIIVVSLLVERRLRAAPHHPVVSGAPTHTVGQREPELLELLRAERGKQLLVNVLVCCRDAQLASKTLEQEPLSERGLEVLL
jgi:hypothetical protein